LFLEATVHAAAVSEEPELALRLAAAAEACRESIGAALFPVMKNLMHEWLAPARKKILPAHAASLWASGQGLSMPKALAEASDWVAGAANPDWSRGGPLSPRELKVAALIAHGRSNREIARELVIAASTAERHVANILRKLDLRSRTEIVTWVMMWTSSQRTIDK
jgi:DNA-binding NarL/FixJ family response regulator